MGGNPAGIRQQAETVMPVREHELTGLACIVGDGKRLYPEIAQANAGLPKLDGEKILYPETPDMAAQIVPRLVKAGANIIGGCCGTTPAHIREIRKTLLQYFPDKLYAANN